MMMRSMLSRMARRNNTHNLTRLFTVEAGQGIPMAPEIPLVIGGERGRIAGELFQTASLAGNLDLVEKEIERIVNGQTKEVVGALEEAVRNVDPKIRSKLITDACVKTKLSEPTAELLMKLLKVDSTEMLPQVHSAFADMVLASKGYVLAYVTSAKPVKDAQKKGLESALAKQFLNKDQKILVRVTEDPRLIGGMKVHIGDVFVDFSLSSMVDSKIGSLYN